MDSCPFTSIQLWHKRRPKRHEFQITPRDSKLDPTVKAVEVGAAQRWPVSWGSFADVFKGDYPTKQINDPLKVPSKELLTPANRPEDHMAAKYTDKELTRKTRVFHKYHLGKTSMKQSSRRGQILHDLPVMEDKTSEHDIVILVMGASGSGKTSFVNLLLNKEVASVTPGSGGCPSQQIRAYPLTDQNSVNRRVLLLDTPGFDDSSCNEYEILENICTWLVRSYRNNAKIAGVVYCHDITQKKWGGSAQKTFEVFEKLCGPAAANKVVLLTTMWNNTTAQARRSAEFREECLKNTYWKDMISKGSIVHREELTNEAVRSIISFLLAQNAMGAPLRIQQELFGMKKMLKDTEAGLTLSAMLRESLDTYKKRAKSSRREGGNQQAILDLEAEIRKIKKQLVGLKTST